jgi:hypothetical protein
LPEVESPAPYVARIGPRPILLFCSLLCLAIGGGFLLMLADLAMQAEDWDWVGAPFVLAFTVLVVVFGLGEGLVPLFAVFTRREALRVDEDGVTLACAPLMLTQHGLWWRTPTVTVFWHEIDAVVLFSLSSSGSSLDVPCIGLRLCADVQLPPGEPRSLGLWRRLCRWMGQSSPPRGVDLYRQIFGWKPDEQRLREAVRLYYDGVRVMVRD